MIEIFISNGNNRFLFQIFNPFLENQILKILTHKINGMGRKIEKQFKKKNIVFYLYV